MDKIRIAIVGIGQRSRAFVEFAKKNEGVLLCGICDKNADRLNDFAERWGCTAPRYLSLDQMLAECAPQGLVITLPDFLHAAAAVKAQKAGCSILLEKPMAPTVQECREIIQCSQNVKVVLGFVLRGHPVYVKIRELLSRKAVGTVMNIEAAEALNVLHGASYMRRWHRKTANTGGFMLAKCSHDIDILSFLLDENPCRVASFGSLRFYTPDKQHHPYCSLCPDQKCPYRFIGEMVEMSDKEAAEPAKYGFDRCVFNDDKDIVDHQVSIFEYPSGVTASFALDLFSPGPTRTMRVIGTEGYIEGDCASMTVKISFSDKTREPQIFDCHATNESGHGGSDRNLFENFLACIRGEEYPAAGLMAGLASTVVGTAIEKAMREKRVVEISPDEYEL